MATVTMHEPESIEYSCPGEKAPISRAVHLGRLARYDPACRQCMHRGDTAGLSPKQVKRLTETHDRRASRTLFHEEGIAGVYLNELNPETAKRLASAFGVCLRNSDPQTAEAPVVVLGGDGSPWTPELTAAVGEGLRWAGCHVVDVGQVSAACLTFAIMHLQASGGVLVHHRNEPFQTVGLKFWAAGAWPLSAGGALEAVQRLFESGVDRPTRRFGSLRRFQADNPYVASLAEHYHAMRPLRLVLDTRCRPLAAYLEKLTHSVACQFLENRITAERLPDEIRDAQAHFAVQVDEDGERLFLWNELGQRIDHEQLLVLVARHLLADEPEAVVVVEQDTSAPTIQTLAHLGVQVVVSGSRRSQMAQAMGEHRARFGGGASGRLWYAPPTPAENTRCPPCPAPPSADALATLTHLLVLLSQTDQPLSKRL